MNRACAIAGVILLAASSPAGAERVFRCTTAGGSVTFQEQPCGAASDERVWEVPDYPPANTAERERLLQRESALDARLVKRAEIEAAERIAREERRTRELEAERTRNAEPAYVGPVYGYGWGGGYVHPHRPHPQPLRNGPLTIRPY